MGPYIPQKINDLNIFVIHCEKDNTVLSLLRHEFHDELFGNYIVKINFLDSANPDNLGADFGETIKKNILNSNFVVAILTEKSRKSVWVNQEIGYTLGCDIELVGLMDKEIVGQGFGFIHSGIDVCMFEYGDIKFDKFKKYLEKKYDKNRSPYILKPISNDEKLKVENYEY